MMRVLDIDLDFFLEDCCPLAEYGSRPDAVGHAPWTEERVREFLEKNCGLNRKHKAPGAIFETHDEALLFWDRLIREKKLTVPFHVTHVDAHSDLGIGKPGPGYVLDCVLAQQTEIRRDIRRHYDMHQLDEANYLLFAVAFRWIGSLDNIRNPRSRPDIPERILSGENGEEIRLQSFSSRLMEARNGAEPVVPFRVFADYEAFRAEEGYDYVTLAWSPRYSPEEADRLIPVISSYIDAE